MVTPVKYKKEEKLLLKIGDLKEQIRDMKKQIWKIIRISDLSKEVAKDINSSFQNEFKEISGIAKGLL